MDNKKTTFLTAPLTGTGIILILMSAFDIIPRWDNVLIFLGLACLIIAGVIKKVAKQGE
ncbi:MAG: hypothetical protein P9L88_01395 [Candidatus Tantalella remota]|nr:hypothetical protein [Candidatus Tantalella remota]